MTRDLSQFFVGNWRIGCAAGCGCLVIVAMAGLFMLCSVAWIGGSLLRGKVEPPPVVEPIMLEPSQAIYTVSNPTIPVDKLATRHESNQNTVTDRRPLPYMPYVNDNATWGNSNATRSYYLAWANLTGARRTPYTRGQVLRYPDGRSFKVVTADFDFSLLQDSQGRRWACPADVNDQRALAACQQWQ